MSVGFVRSLVINRPAAASLLTILLTTFFDGTSTGKTEVVQLLETLIGIGIAGVIIIPNQNWNLKDQATKKL